MKTCPLCRASVPSDSDACAACGCTMAISVGSTIGTWTIVAPLAVGGMSTVFKAEHSRLKRPVCVKVVSGAFGQDPELLARFEREAQVLAAISHPNVVSVLDFGALPGGGLYLVCEFVEGRNLRVLLQQSGPLPVPRAVGLIRQVLKGLEAAHRQNVVHRDIKPANVLVKQLPDGTELAQLADFGIARVVPPMEVTEAGLTKKGVMVGTPGYMAPEQILAEAVDARSDIYAVGVVLYELLTGARMFGQTGGVDVLMKHVSIEPSPPLTSPEHAWLNAVVLKALSKSADNRFPTAAAFAQALEPALSPSAPPRVLAPPPKPPRISSPSEVKVPPRASAPVAEVQKSERARALLTLMQQWSNSTGAARADTTRAIETKLAEWLGQGVLEPLLEVFPALAAKRETELEGVIRALIVERIGAVVRAATDAQLQTVLSFAGPEAHHRLITNLRSVENAELASQLARAVMQGPLRELTDHIARMTPTAVGSVVRASSSLPLGTVRPILVLCLNHLDAQARLAAVDGLSASHALQLVAEVRKRLNDKDRSVRQRAASLLGTIEDRASVPSLATMLTRAESAAERGTLAVALAEMGGPDAATAVRTAFVAEKDLPTRCTMAEALGRFGDGESLEVLARECSRLLAPAELKAIGRRFPRR